MHALRRNPYGLLAGRFITISNNKTVILVEGAVEEMEQRAVQRNNN